MNKFRYWFTIDAKDYQTRDAVVKFLKKTWGGIRLKQYGSGLRGHQQVDYTTSELGIRNGIKKDLKEAFPAVKFISYRPEKIVEARKVS